MLECKYLKFKIYRGGVMNNFIDVIRQRRSADKFKEGIKVPREDFESIFKDLSLAPSAFNLQHANYYVVEDEALKESMYEASHKQHKIKTASAVIVVTGNKKAYKEADKIYEGTLMLGILQQFEYNHMMDMINGLYEGWGESFQHDEAVRNASLSSMLFMLLAKNLGWDTCPMNYFKKDDLRSALSLGEHEEPVLMIPIGKADTSSQKIRGFRKPSGDYVKYM